MTRHFERTIIALLALGCVIVWTAKLTGSL